MSKNLHLRFSSLGHVSLRPVTIDDIAQVRHLHTAVLKSIAVFHISDSEVDELVKSVNSCEYIAAVADSNLTGAWIDGQLAGTAAWEPVGANRPEARLHMLFVWPLFSRSGVGRTLVTNAETEASQAGCRAMRTRAEVNQAAFFLRLGYGLSSHGAMRTPAGVAIPVVYMRKDKLQPALDLRNHEGEISAVMYKH
jgi:GNAT superfamily N-acetyltransferase